MKYYKYSESGYILAVGTGGMGEEITDDEYNAILAVIHNKPLRTETTNYRLKTDLTWESYEVEPPDPDPEPTIEDKAEAYDILTGVSE